MTRSTLRMNSWPFRPGLAPIGTDRMTDAGAIIPDDMCRAVRRDLHPRTIVPASVRQLGPFPCHTNVMANADIDVDAPMRFIVIGHRHEVQGTIGRHREIDVRVAEGTLGCGANG